MSEIGRKEMSTSIKFSPEIENRLKILAKETGRSKSFYINQMVEDRIDEVEEYYLAEATFERISAGKERIYSSASVREQLGLDN